VGSGLYIAGNKQVKILQFFIFLGVAEVLHFELRNISLPHSQ